MSAASKQSSRIAGVVVLHRPDASAAERAATYAGVLDRLYVFDNSPGESRSALEKIQKLPVEVTHLSEKGNRVMARALNAAAAAARRDGYDWLMTMDQDSSFDGGMAAALVSAFESLPGKEGAAVISPSHWKRAQEEGGELPAFDEPPVVMTSGNLLNLAVHERLGGFAEDLFIDTVDHDYCLRARAAGFRVVQFRGVWLKHQVGLSLLIQKAGRKVRITTHAPERMYYITRNNLRLWFRHYGKDPRYIRHRIGFYFGVTIRNILRYEDQKMEKLRFAARGALDFLRGRYGPYGSSGSGEGTHPALPAHNCA